MSDDNFFYYKNDNLIELKALKDEIAGTYVNNATVTATVKDADGANVTGQSWPLTLTYVTASNGIYRGILEAALDVDVGDRLTVEVTVDGGGGKEAFFQIPTRVRQRGKN